MSLDWLVIGTGMMGGITPPIIEQAGGRVTGVLGSSNSKVAKFLREGEGKNLRNVQIAGEFSDLDVLLKLQKAPFDAVAILVPNYLHADMGIKVANARRHILIEKPLTTSPETAARLYDAVTENGIAADVNSQYRHHEIIGTFIERFANEIVNLEMGYIQGWMAEPTDAIGWRPEVAVAGRGKLVGDLGSHVLQTTLHLFGGGEFTEFNGVTYNVHPKRWRPKEATQSFADVSDMPDPDDRPDLWEEMDMLGEKYSGDDRASAEFTLRTPSGRIVNGKYILSQVDPGNAVMGNENNFYIRATLEDGNEVRWFQETPNHLEVYGSDGEVVERIERGSAPGMKGRPGGHPHGYGDCMLIEIDKLQRVASSGDAGAIRTYTRSNIGHGRQAVQLIDKWLKPDLQPYGGELDGWLADARALRTSQELAI